MAESVEAPPLLLRFWVSLGQSYDQSFFEMYVKDILKSNPQKLYFMAESELLVSFMLSFSYY
jgi:hypothetical protein